MDEAFVPLNNIIGELSAINQGFIDENAGVHTYISGIEIETPVELDITVDENGKVRIGTIPPLYRVDTSFRPSYHQIKFNVIKNNTENGE